MSNGEIVRSLMLFNGEIVGQLMPSWWDGIPYKYVLNETLV